MTQDNAIHFSRRERQIMDVIYRKGEASVAEVLEGLPDPPSYSAVRAMLRILEEKGHLKHRQKGLRYIYSPKVVRKRASKSAIRQMLKTFFDNSTEDAVAALLDVSKNKLTHEELNRLAAMIQKAKKEGR